MRMIRVAVLALLPSGAAAQLLDTATVPRELALALLAQGRGEQNIFIGKSANSIATSAVPAGTVALGGLGGATVFVFSEATRDAMATVTRHLAATGWSEPKEGPVGSSRTFMAAGMGPGGYSAWCKDTSSAILLPRPRSGGGTYLTVTIGPKRQSMCDEAMWGRPGARMGMSMDYGLLEPPPLAPPEGATGTPTGTSGSDRERTLSATYESKLNAEQMVAHFGKQLEKAGWEYSSRSGVKDVAMYVVKRTDDKGVSYRGVLVDVMHEPGKHSLQLTLSKNVKYPWEP